MFLASIIYRKKILFHCNGRAGNCDISKWGVGGEKMLQCCQYCRCKKIAEIGLTINGVTGFSYFSNDPSVPARDIFENCEIEFDSAESESEYDNSLFEEADFDSDAHKLGIQLFKRV